MPECLGLWRVNYPFRPDNPTNNWPPGQANERHLAEMTDVERVCRLGMQDAHDIGLIAENTNQKDCRNAFSSSRNTSLGIRTEEKEFCKSVVILTGLSGSPAGI